MKTLQSARGTWFLCLILLLSMVGLTLSLHGGRAGARGCRVAALSTSSPFTRGPLQTPAKIAIFRSAVQMSDNDEDGEESKDDEDEEGLEGLLGVSMDSLVDKDSLAPLGVGGQIIDPNIMSVDLNDELKTAFMSYAMSTILGRALPDARDGLKPVHRRVLYAMQILNLSPESSHRKCARVVGEVLGKFHPHGDQSVYDALVRMAQNFATLHPLVNGHGNFGSVDNDPPAAMRYTEAKLTQLAYDSLLSEIKDETVDFIANFDGNEEEPVVLPAKLPMLLLNGAIGVAVGMATNIPPHNLGELCDAIVALIGDPNLSEEELFKIVPAPDFPTGAKIMGISGAHDMYRTGRGSVTIRSTAHMETLSQTTKGVTRTKNAIIVTELPYLTNKASLLEKIADLVNDKKLDGISDLRDESDRNGIRVVIELKRDAIPSIVENNLYKKTALQSTFSGNMLALIDEGKQPMRINLRQALDVFIDFRFTTLRRRTSFVLGKLKARNHIVEGLLKALGRIDDIIKLIRTSKDSSKPKEVLMSDAYGLSNEQASAILDLRLGRLTGLEESKLREENKQLMSDISHLMLVMSDDTLVNEIMTRETLELKAKHAVPRKSVLWGEEAALSEEDLLANERSVVVITQSGYAKRMPLEEYNAQARGSKGKASTRLATDEDMVSNFFSCNDHDALLFMTNRGIAYNIKAYQIPIASRYARGVPLPQILPIGSGDTVTSVIPIDSFEKEDFLVLLTKEGLIKRTPLKAFESVSARGLIIISLKESDNLRWVRRCLPDEEIIIATRDGYASRFRASDVTATGRNSIGVRALRLREGDEMADMDIFQSKMLDASLNPTSRPYLLAVTEKGYGKRIEVEDFPVQRRARKGVIAIKFKERAGGSRKSVLAEGKSVDVRKDFDSLRCMRVCSTGDEVVLSTEKGTVLRQRIDDLTVLSRAATGCRLQKIPADDSVVMVDIIPQSAISAMAEEGNGHDLSILNAAVAVAGAIAIA